MTDFMFRAGDKVYHPVFGEGTVTEVDTKDLVEPYRVEYDYGTAVWSRPGYLSFSPWPKPCHERPFTEVGWWIGKLSHNDNPIIRWRITEKDHKFNKNNKASYSTRDEEINWIKFLGTEL